MNTLKSIWAWTGISLLILLWAPVMAIVSLTDRDPGRYRTGRWFRRLGSAITHVNPAWRIKRSGRLPADPRLPYVVVGNHQSMADIPVLSRLPWDMKWVSKKSLFKVPLIGWMMRISRDIPVDRKDSQSRAAVLAHATERMEQRISVMFFPEGTRSRDGRVGRFNDGAFRLAIQTGTPVLPIAIDGATDALPKQNWRFGKRSDILLHVFDPVPVHGLTKEEAPVLRERVRQQVIAKLAEWRETDPASVDTLAEAPRD